MLAGTPRDSPPDPTAVTGRDRATVLTCVLLLAIAAASWVHVLVLPMGADDMAGMDMAMSPTVADGLAFVAAWSVMMAAMMLPSALPMIGLYAATQRNAAGRVGKVMRVALFALVYSDFVTSLWFRSSRARSPWCQSQRHVSTMSSATASPSLADLITAASPVG